MILNIYTNTRTMIDFKSFDTIITVINDITWLPPTACIITNSSEMVQIVKTKICTAVNYTIGISCRKVVRTVFKRVSLWY